MVIDWGLSGNSRIGGIGLAVRSEPGISESRSRIQVKFGSMRIRVQFHTILVWVYAGFRRKQLQKLGYEFMFAGSVSMRGIFWNQDNL